MDFCFCGRDKLVEVKKHAKATALRRLAERFVSLA
jgi:hypothetical protein